MINEFNKSENEYGKMPDETKSVTENVQFYETKNASRDTDESTQAKNGKKPKKKKTSGKTDSNMFMRLASSFAAIATVTVVAASGTLPSKSINVEIAEAWSTDTQIMYQLHLDEVEDDLKIVVYNDFTHRETNISADEIIDGSYMGTCENLKPNVSYTLAVKTNYGFGDKTLVEKKLKTMKTEDMPVTVFNSVKYEWCDGYFYFTMDFLDENYYWSDFTATLTDSYGMIYTCVFADDLHAEQFIEVIVEAIDMEDLHRETATFTITCKSTETGELTEKVLYTAEVQI